MEDNALTSAIDNHNVASDGESWFDTRINAVGEFAGDVGEAVTKGSIGAVVAGVDSILNTGIAASNFLGGEIEPINTYEVLKNLDDDLGEYYKEHQAGVETAGFIATSFIPGMAGVKAIQAAKAGFLGSNMARASGLMVSLTRDYAKAAKLEFAAGNSPFSVLNANTIKALAQGLGSSALDMAAFETAVTATMYKSPMLDEQDIKDVFWNIAAGTVVGGGIGGVLHGVKLGYDISKIGKMTDLELFNYNLIKALPETATPDLKLINLYQQKFNMPAPELNMQYRTELDPAVRLDLVNKAYNKTQERIDIQLRQTLTDMAGGDGLIGQQLFKVLDASRSLEEVTGALMYTRQLNRITRAESLEYGDVIFPQHKMPIEKFNTITTAGKMEDLFTPSATKETQGYKIIGDISKLQVGNYGRELLNKETAFAKNYDVYRNANGTFSVNPESKILQASDVRRLPNNRIIDFEQNGAVVDKATAGLADLASKDSPISVRGDVVLAGNLDPIKIGDTLKFNPTEGSYLDAQARYIWAQEQKNIVWKNKVIGENDLPLLEKAYYDGNKSQGFAIKTADGKVSIAPTGERLSQFIQSKKYELARKLNGTPLDEIGYRLNISDKWLQGEEDDIAKIRPGVDYQLPRYGRVDYAPEVDAAKLYDTMKLDGAIQYEIQKNLVELRHQQNFASFAQESTLDFPPRPNWSDPGRAPTREGAGASLLGFANGNYGSAQGWAQVTGIATSRLKTKLSTKLAQDANPLMALVVQDGQDAVTELALLENTLRSSPEAWVQHPNGEQTLIPRKDYKLVLRGGEPTDFIDVQNENVWNLRQFFANENASNQVHVRNIKGAAGVGDNSDPAVWYPVPLDTTKYKHFVFVEPREISLPDKKRMIVAKDEATLNKMIAQVDQNKFNVITKVDKEEWHKALGDYNFSLGINESSVDSALKRKGVMGEFFPNVSADRVMQDMLDWHLRQKEILVTRMVEHNYSQAFQELELLGRDYTNIATSQFRSLTQKLESGTKDPYNELVKTALDISTGTEARYQWWRSFNDTIKDAIEVPINKMREIFRNAPDLTDTDLEKINGISDRMGMGRPFETAYQANVAAGNIADKPWLARGIAKAQGIMSSTLLQLDFFNAINNAVSAPIITSAEVNNLVRGIMNGDERVAGKLSKLMSTPLPDGSGVTIPSTMKLVKNALENYRLDAVGDGALLKRYQKIGAVTDILQQERQMLDHLTFNWKETSAQVDSKLKQATDFGRKWTGNQMAEEMTRFVAADVMRQITDLAMESGVLKDASEANEYIQLFTNRTQGNYLHSQRPIVFQGVVGQAISLFQTYQFNLMQQMFRYVGEGDSKSIALLLGLQGSIYGMQGLPAFNFLNTHIVGNASGNTEHKDLYQASYSVFGKSLGDWILYGAGSNALGLIDPSMKINLYSRGDINPRQLTVLPTTLADIPIVNASVKFVTNLYQVAQKISSDGSAWPAISQGLEHNGLSRPLAGLAQIAQGYSTTSQGSLLSASQDFWNIATLSRVAGGKPFDEAIALDAMYRINAYKAKDTSNLQNLGAAIKSSMIGGKAPTQDQIESFAASYAKSGGRIENFSKFFTNSMINATESQVNKIATHLQSPYAQQLQIIMGGRPLPDFLNTPAEQ